MKRAIIILIKVTQCAALLRMLLVCIRSYLKSVLGCKFLTLDTYPDTLSVREQGCKDPCLFLETETCPRAKRFQKNFSKGIEFFM
jgi:hypothetical protein